MNSPTQRIERMAKYLNLHSKHATDITIGSIKLCNDRPNEHKWAQHIELVTKGSIEDKYTEIELCFNILDAIIDLYNKDLIGHSFYSKYINMAKSSYTSKLCSTIYFILAKARNSIVHGDSISEYSNQIIFEIELEKKNKAEMHISEECFANLSLFSYYISIYHENITAYLVALFTKIYNSIMNGISFSKHVAIDCTQSCIKSFNFIPRKTCYVSISRIGNGMFKINEISDSLQLTRHYGIDFIFELNSYKHKIPEEFTDNYCISTETINFFQQRHSF